MLPERLASHEALQAVAQVGNAGVVDAGGVREGRLRVGEELGFEQSGCGHGSIVRRSRDSGQSRGLAKVSG